MKNKNLQRNSVRLFSYIGKGLCLSIINTVGCTLAAIFVLGMNVIAFGQTNQPFENLYAKGVYYEEKGQIDEAMYCYQGYCNGCEEERRIDTLYLDAILRMMNYCYQSQEYNRTIELGYRAIGKGKTVLTDYSYTPELFTTLVVSLNYCNKFADVPNLLQKGMVYVDQIITPNSERYYQLPFGGTVAYLMMGDCQKADSVYKAMCASYTSSNKKMVDLELGLNNIHELILSQENEGWLEKRERSKAAIQQIGDNLLLANPATPEGASQWKQYLELIRETLGFYYFDLFNPNDEIFYNWCLAQLITRYFVCCDNLIDRECESYDNILLRKNFLEYHYGKSHKTPCTWRNVATMLEDDEAAIEISMLPDEILVLRNDGEKPICIPIDSVLFEEIVNRDLREPMEIGLLYGQSGPLQKLWSKVEPHLNGISTLYISALHLFNQYNYSAIPINDHALVSDKYEVHFVMSTADIEHVKRQSNTFLVKDALLVGGIDFEKNSDTVVAGKNRGFILRLSERAPSHLDEINNRGRFNYLEGSMREVVVADSLLKHHGIRTWLLTGGKATEDVVKQVSEQAPDLIHFATHGFMLAPLFNTNETVDYSDTTITRYQTILSQSGVLLSGANFTWQGREPLKGTEDGVLHSDEILKLDFSQTQMVILSACDSGLGETGNLTGASFGVQYAFKYAGVNKVLVCLWPVDDQATAVFMELFYKRLLSEGNPNSALMKARKDMIEIGFNEQYYWAPFVLLE